MGRRDHWLGLDLQTFRSWAITPLAITLGLSPPHPAEAARVPKRARVLDMIHSDSKTLPPDCIYVGRGHHSHRIPTTKWKSLCVPGHDCPLEDWALSYVHQIRTFQWDQLHELQGLTLVCDCPDSDLCEADLLAGMVFDATTPPLEHEPTNSRRRRPRTTQVMAALLSSRVVHVSSVTVPTQWFPQESVVLAFQKLFPAAWFDGFKFPLVEDLLNSSPFVEFQEWRAEVWGSWEGPFNPVLAPPSVRLVQRHAEGQQAGAFATTSTVWP